MTTVGTLGRLTSLGTRPPGIPGTARSTPPFTGVTTPGITADGTTLGIIVLSTTTVGMIRGTTALTTMVGMADGTTLGSMIPGIMILGIMILGIMEDGTATTAGMADTPGTTMAGATDTVLIGVVSAEATGSIGLE